MAVTQSQPTRLLASGLVPRRPGPRRRAVPFFLVLVTVVLLGNAIVGDRGLTALILANDESVAISAIITMLRAENEELREDVRELRESTRGIEALARGELGLITPGETMFIVDHNPPDTPVGLDHPTGSVDSDASR